MGLGSPMRPYAVTYVVGRRFLRGILGDQLLAVELGDLGYIAIELLAVLDFVLRRLLIMMICVCLVWLVHRVGWQAHSGVGIGASHCLI